MTKFEAAKDGLIRDKATLVAACRATDQCRLDFSPIHVAGTGSSLKIDPLSGTPDGLVG